MNDANEKHKGKGPPGCCGVVCFTPHFAHMSHVSPLWPPRPQTLSARRAQIPPSQGALPHGAQT